MGFFNLFKSKGKGESEKNNKDGKAPQKSQDKTIKEKLREELADFLIELDFNKKDLKNILCEYITYAHDDAEKLYTQWYRDVKDKSVSESRLILNAMPLLKKLEKRIKILNEVTEYFVEVQHMISDTWLDIKEHTL